MSLSDVYSDLDNSETLFPSCKTCHWYTNLEPGDRAFFDKVVADPRANMRKLLRACEAHSGLKIAPSSLRNHVQRHHKMLVEALS